MNDLTERQEEYLLLIAERSSGWSLTELANELDVSKPTAYNVVDTLERLGYVQRDYRKAIYLSESGRKQITRTLETAQELTRWLMERGGLSAAEAGRSARSMAISSAPEVVRVILNDWYELSERPVPSPEKRLDALPDGLYSVGVRLCKKDSTELSHGDDGIRKPALLIKENGAYWLFVLPKDLKRKILGFPLLTGRLEKLWYRLRDEWHECESDDEGVFRLPYESLRLLLRGRKQLGVASVRVKVNAGVFSMPDSEAELEFDLSSIEGI